MTRAAIIADCAVALTVFALFWTLRWWLPPLLAVWK